MLSLRRYVTYTVSAGCILFLLSYIWQPSGSASPGRSNGSDLDLEAFTNPTTGRLIWSKVPVRYPPKSLIALPTASPSRLPKVQYDFPPETSAKNAERLERQAAIKTVFESCWKLYSDRAWMKDEVSPISGKFVSPFGGWAATLVDSLDTLWIMGMKDDFVRAVDAVVEIDLSQSTTMQINVFETTIRHLGGLLAAYDLSGDKRLLEKAREFGDMLIVAFDTPNRMPITRWYPFESFRGPQRADTNVLVAEIGSLTLEFTRLSLLTGDPKWYDAVMRIVEQLEKQQSTTFLPGMWPVTIDAQHMNFASDSFFTLSAMSDSLYEYFPKMHALLGGIGPLYEKLHKDSMATAERYNLFRPMTPDEADILISGEIRKTSRNGRNHAQLDPQGQHLVCFAGGMFALGSKLFEIDHHMEIAKKLIAGCIWAYRAMPLGIMPEKFRMLPCPSREECAWNETAWKDRVLVENPDHDVEETIRHLRLPEGFTEIVDARYVLRPEAIESVFLLYRMTGDPDLLEAAWSMWTSISLATQTKLGGNAALSDVTIPATEWAVSGDQYKMDSMESFWMAETLKYFYLMFSEPDLISLDEWVFNTEAHPLKRRLPSR